MSATGLHKIALVVGHGDLGTGHSVLPFRRLLRVRMRVRLSAELAGRSNSVAHQCVACYRVTGSVPTRGAIRSTTYARFLDSSGRLVCPVFVRSLEGIPERAGGVLKRLGSEPSVEPHRRREARVPEDAMHRSWRCVARREDRRGAHTRMHWGSHSGQMNLDTVEPAATPGYPNISLVELCSRARG